MYLCDGSSNTVTFLLLTNLPSCLGRDVSAELKRIHCVTANQILEHHNTPYTMSLTSEKSATVP